MPNGEGTIKPNDVLAEQIVSELVEAGLISERHKIELQNKFKAGGVEQEDWILWVDLATAPNKEVVDE